MPESTNSQSYPIGNGQRKEMRELMVSLGTATTKQDVTAKAGATEDDRARERRENRSTSPTATAPLAAERPKSPASPSSPGFTSLPPFPASPTALPRHAREPSKSFFSNLKASKSSAKIHPAEPTIRKVQQESNQNEDSARKPLRTKSTPDLRGANVAEPVPELPGLDASSPHLAPLSGTGHKIPRRPVGNHLPAVNVTQPSVTARGATGPGSPIPDSQESRRNPRLFHNFMRRNHSSKSDDVASSSKPGTPISSKAPDVVNTKPPSRDQSTGRNPSPLAENEEASELKVQLKDQRSLSFRENAGSTLMHGLKNTAKAAGGIGKAGTKFFKQTKQPHGLGSYPMDSAQFYQLKVINRPLREQTRVTRIAKRLEDSKDKTEFWMPALPWRCIDFLNFNGCEIEGLYRVPGSDREVKMWKQRFDQEYDVNLFEEEDLYDVNTVGSLFKAWLRELPEEIFSLKTQEELSEKYRSQEKAPDELREILSELPPWNYYLLFATTCHLSLLNAYQEKNKMTFHNLYVCFAPALKMNNDCFRWLVADWRNCWKGCVTESEALKDEYRILDGDLSNSEEPPMFDETERSVPARESSEAAQPPTEISLAESRAPSTPSKIKPRVTKEPTPIKVSSARSKDDSELPTGRQQNKLGSSSLLPNTPSHNRSASQLPELSFPQPISPIFASQT